MSKQTLFLAGAALLFAGAAQAAAPQASADPEYPAVSRSKAPAPTTGDDMKEAYERGAQVAELHPDARPVYLNGGYFDTNQANCE